MKHRFLFMRLRRGHLNNVPFKDMVSLLEGFGFQLARVSGSHHIFSHAEIPELINLQDVRGEVKPYQIRQALDLIERYDLTLGD